MNGILVRQGLPVDRRDDAVLAVELPDECHHSLGVLFTLGPVQEVCIVDHGFALPLAGLNYSVLRRSAHTFSAWIDPGGEGPYPPIQ